MKTDYPGIQIPDFFILLKFLKIKKMCAMDVFRELKLTYAHIHNLKHTFVKLGWITLEKEDRKQNMVLTEKGLELVEILNEFLEKINFNDIEKIKKYLYKDKIMFKKLKEDNNDEEKKAEQDIIKNLLKGNK